MTDEETAEIKQEIVSLEIRYARALRECFWLEGQIFQLRQKLKSVSPEGPEDREESLRVCRSIGSKLKTLDI